MCTRLIYLITVVLLSGLTTSVSAKLVGQWPLDGNANDTSGNGYNGVVSGGVTYVEGKFGLAADFNGRDAQINCGDVPALGGGNSLSVAFWVKPRNLAQDWAGYVSKWTADNARRSFWIGQHSTDGWLRFGIYPGGPTAESPLDTGKVILANGEWTHVVCTCDVDIQRIYANGAEVVVGPKRTAPLVDRGGNLRFGIVSTANWFNGLLDDIRIFSHVLTNTEIQAVVRGEGRERALVQQPQNGAVNVPREVVLSWAPGEFAQTHDVYFGAVFADVNNASRTSPLSVLVSQGQMGTTYQPAKVLEYGKTYYWRVDEVNAPPASTVFKGAVWSFTVEPAMYPLKNVTATASSSAAGQGPEKTIDGSGLDASDLHGTTDTTMWLTDGSQPAWIQYTFDGVYKLQEMWVWNSNQSLESAAGMGAKDVGVEYSADGVTWTKLAGVPPFARAPGKAAYAHNTTVAFHGAVARYVKLAINSNWGGIMPQTGLSEVRFFYKPVQASSPQPTAGQTGVAPDIVLRWRPGHEAAAHQVYFGTDPNALMLAGTTIQPSFVPPAVKLGTSYYWRVEEVNAVETPNSWTGKVWSFSTLTFLVVDDFESYTDAEGKRIYETWADGYGSSDNGSQVGNDQAPFAEQKIIHGGKQAMPLKFDNTAKPLSEAKRTWTTAQDWTASGIKSLSLYFAGAAGNKGQLYVKINNKKVLYGGDAADLARPLWQPWNIDLSVVGGELSRVTTLVIGIEGVGAKGVVSIDDICLCPRVPELIVPAAPKTANLVALYTFDGSAKDSSGNGFNGQEKGGPTYGAGVVGQAIKLDGVDDYVDVGNPPTWPSGKAARSISLWAVTYRLGTGYRMAVSYGTPATSKAMCLGQSGTSLVGAGWGGDLTLPNFWALDAWHHICLTYDGTTARLYADGVEVVSGARDWSLTLSQVRIGGQMNNAEFWQGSLDDLRVYGRVLSAGEIAWLAGRTMPFDKAF